MSCKEVEDLKTLGRCAFGLLGFGYLGILGLIALSPAIILGYAVLSLLGVV